MKQKHLLIPGVLLVLLVVLWAVWSGPKVSTAEAMYNWPQWRGADRTGVSQETGLLKEWPANGPEVSWSASGLGAGFGTVAIDGHHIFLQGARNNQSVIHCLKRSDGKVLWTTALGPQLEHGRGGGPRGTPTVDGDRIYALTENGDLACLNKANGSVLWGFNILERFKGRNISWHISESPLVDGNRLVVTPGGPEASIVALDKMSGETLWTTKELSDRAGYASCVVADVGEVRTIMTFTHNAGVGVRAQDGKLMWRYEPVANRTANCTTPVFHENKVFYSSNYNTGCALLELKPNRQGLVRAEEVYFNRYLMNHHGGVVLVDGHLYGFHNAILTCMEFETGKVMWKDRSVGKGSLTYADGRLYLFSEKNVVGLAEASPRGYREKGRFSVKDQGWPSWAYPVVCGGKLYIRNQGLLTCYNIQAS